MWRKESSACTLLAGRRGRPDWWILPHDMQLCHRPAFNLPRPRLLSFTKPNPHPLTFPNPRASYSTAHVVARTPKCSTSQQQLSKLEDRYQNLSTAPLRNLSNLLLFNRDRPPNRNRSLVQVLHLLASISSHSFFGFLLPDANPRHPPSFRLSLNPTPSEETRQPALFKSSSCLMRKSLNLSQVRILKIWIHPSLRLTCESLRKAGLILRLTVLGKRCPGWLLGKMIIIGSFKLSQVLS